MSQEPGQIGGRGGRGHTSWETFSRMVDRAMPPDRNLSDEDRLTLNTALAEAAAPLPAKTTVQTFDVNGLPPGHRATWKVEAPEDPEDRTHRHKMEAEAAAHARKVSRENFWTAVIAMGVMGVAALLFLAFTNDVQIKTWAIAVLAGIASGATGYAVGKK